MYTYARRRLVSTKLSFFGRYLGRPNGDKLVVVVFSERSKQDKLAQLEKAINSGGTSGLKYTSLFLRKTDLYW